MLCRNAQKFFLKVYTTKYFGERYLEDCYTRPFWTLFHCSVMDLRDGGWDISPKVKFWMSLFKYSLISIVRTMTANCGKVKEGDRVVMVSLGRGQNHVISPWTVWGEDVPITEWFELLLVASSIYNPLKWMKRDDFETEAQHPRPSWTWTGLCHRPVYRWLLTPQS